MAKNPPAFLFYSANLIANKWYRGMSFKSGAAVNGGESKD